MKTYHFYGWQQAGVPAVNGEYPGIRTPLDLYDKLAQVWCAETKNRTLGQCSITAFLAQDIFGGQVYGILRPGGNYHCYNVVDGHIFDLTSEQFGGEALCYEGNPEQSRQAHFAKEEKYRRYLLLKQRLREVCGAPAAPSED